MEHESFDINQECSALNHDCNIQNQRLNEANQDCTELFKNFRDKNNEDSFRKFVNIVETPLLEKINFYIHDDDASKDILQKTWERVLIIKDKYDDSIASPITWIWEKIAKGKTKQWIRDNTTHSDRFVQLESDEGLEIDNDDDLLSENSNIPEISVQPVKLTPLDITSIKNKYQILHKAVLNLQNQNHQDVIILKDFGGLKLDCIANIMNRNENTVRGWHKRAIETLKNFFEKQGIEL